MELNTVDIEVCVSGVENQSQNDRQLLQPEENVAGDTRAAQLVDVDTNVFIKLLPYLGFLNEDIPVTQAEALVKKAMGAHTQSSWFNKVSDGVDGCSPSDAFWIKVASKTQILNVGKLDAIIEVLVDSLAEAEGGDGKALLWILQNKKLAEYPIEILVKHLLQRGASVSILGPNRNTPLHIAAMRDLANTAKLLLQQHASVKAYNADGKSPLELAIDNKSNQAAVVIIKAMEPESVREMFEPGKDGPRLSLHTLLSCADTMQATIMATLDTMLEPVIGRTDTFFVYYKILDADSQGRSPVHPHFNRTEKSCLQLIAKSKNKDIVYHDVIRLLLRQKWKAFARLIFFLQFLLYALFMGSLTCALVIGAKRERPEHYDHQYDILRGICEAFILLLVLYGIPIELIKMIRHRLSYFQDYHNYFNLAAMVSILLIVPFRIARLNFQWIFASLGFLLNGLKAFRYTAVFRSTGAYTEILLNVTLNAILQFSAIFFIFLYSFSGSLYFALRGEVSIAYNTSENSTEFKSSSDLYPFETKEFYHVLFTGLRVLVEGNVIDGYFGPNGFGLFSVIIYLVYLFIIAVVMLNLLIAQLSDTYSNVQRDAQKSLMLNRARIVANVEHNSLIAPYIRRKFYHTFEEVEHPSELLEKWEVPPINEVNKKLEKMEKLLKKQEEIIQELCNALGRNLELQRQIRLQQTTSSNDTNQIS